MVVGGIGYAVNMATYYPLTLWFQNQVTFLQQQFYLPPFLISSGVAILSNYVLNKRFTFGDRQESSLGFFKYFGTCAILVPVDMVFLFLLVQYAHFVPIVGAALAILVMFLLRFFILKRFVFNLSKFVVGEKSVDCKSPSHIHIKRRIAQKVTEN
jgi:putative flippase GtrA